jgi:hypothetical protein
METGTIEGDAGRCRFSAHAVVAGAIVELVCVSMLAMLGGGMGLWRAGILDAGAMSGAGPLLALWLGASLIVAGFIGGFIAAIASRSISAEDGLLHGLLTWAVACLTGAVLACTWLMAALATGVAKLEVVNAMDNRMMLAFVVADALALIAALAGGRWGARQEAHLRAVPPQPAPGLRTTPRPA